MKYHLENEDESSLNKVLIPSLVAVGIENLTDENKDLLNKLYQKFDDGVNNWYVHFFGRKGLATDDSVEMVLKKSDYADLLDYLKRGSVP